jgi:methylated-DNA-[protein]-cysteine S-methyltransferase
MTSTVAFAGVPTSHGKVLAAVTEIGVAATTFHDTPEAREWITRRLALPVVADTPRVDLVQRELAAYFGGELREFTVEVDWRLMSASQQAVLGTLYRSVPYGSVVTYGELARLSGTGIPARGIGSIMGSNPIPIIVPCHRVTRGSEMPHAYVGGEQRRLTLNDFEREQLTLHGA